MKAYLKKHGSKLLVLVLVAALIVGFAKGRSNGRAGAISGISNALSSPVQRAVGSMVGWLEGIYGYIYQYGRLLEENESLRRQLAEAQAEARSAQEASDENVRLRELLGYLEKNTSFVTESAQITAWDASNWVSAFTLGKGSDQGIEPGDCVVTEFGALVGQVSETGGNFATVRTLIDVNTGVGVLVGDSQIAAMLVGDYALMREGLCKLSYFTDDVTLFVGDKVITSGKGGAFPSGISVGTVEELRSEAGGQSYYAVVRPDVALGTLSQIFIIKDFEVVE